MPVRVPRNRRARQAALASRARPLTGGGRLECERFHEDVAVRVRAWRPSNEEVARRVVAFVVSFAIAILGMVVVHLYGRHRPVGAPLTWGEAIVAATFVFFLMFWAYGVVPNQWLQWANNELGWTPSKKLRDGRSVDLHQRADSAVQRQLREGA